MRTEKNDLAYRFTPKIEIPVDILVYQLTFKTLLIGFVYVDLSVPASNALRSILNRE